MSHLSLFKKAALIDDDPDLLESLRRVLSAEGLECASFERPEDFLKTLQMGDCPYDLIITDLQMPGIGGVEVLGELQRQRIVAPTLVMTAFASFETAVESIRAGAFDYVVKPFKPEELVLKIRKAEEFAFLSRENARLQKETVEARLGRTIVGESKSVRALKELIRRVSGTDSNVLITGESGTGKELVARSIHQEGPRGKAPFIAINCAAIPSELLEAELFGYEKGAFTGASQKKSGLFVEADRGTLFLDEIGDMPLDLQSKLLRVVQERTVRPVGGVSSRPIDVRLVCATHQDLQALVKRGLFREDLFYRVNVIRLEVPPLRSRVGDVPILVRHFLKRYGGSHYRVTADAMKRFERYAWKGNVRELQNAIERAVVLSDSHVLGVDAFEFLNSIGESGEASSAAFETLEEVERSHIQTVLKAVSGHKDKASKILGIDRKTLYRKLKIGTDTLSE